MVITIPLLPQFHICASDASWVTIELISCAFAWKTSLLEILRKTS